ncbi:DUF397 domain-containing protein [Streptomyces albipurpureus]|uniref:DUF397 domain-containing protein n=1 Tax=Streptomyces albipurpureus TaxID=2897419 RepID=A0ABT0UX10_9ACTN|nr:DUF397 domain-containing protein [Streptomyces sp. CWNU-1]MCM2393117.1 DUF397 domain-containing protein [Streptomyces sp. CWNU-1]
MIREAFARGPDALPWFKSSHSSNSSEADCIEVAWTKSSYSDSSNGNDCVEVATTPTCVAIHIRDSKNTQGPQLAVTPFAWAEFVSYASKY